MRSSTIQFDGAVPSMAYDNLVAVDEPPGFIFASAQKAVCVTRAKPDAVGTVRTTVNTGAVLSVSYVNLAGSPLAEFRYAVAVARECATEVCFGTGQSVVVCSSETAGADAAASCVKLCVIQSTLHVVVGSPMGVVTFYEIVRSSASSTLVCSKVTAARTHESREVTALVIIPPRSDCSVMAASGDCGGHTVLWGHNRAPILTLPPAHPSECVTSLALVILRAGARPVLLAIALGTGTVRFYNDAGALQFEVAANAKWINAMAFSPTHGVLATAGEDSVVNVFSLPSSPGAQDCALVGQLSLANRLPTGLAFVPRTKELAVTCYDTKEITLISF